MRPLPRFLSYVAVAGAAALVGFFVLPRYFERRPLPGIELGKDDSSWRPNGFARIVLGGWLPKHVEEIVAIKMPWWNGGGTLKLIELEVVHGEAFVNDKHILREDITAYVDARVSPDCYYVVLFPAKGSTMGDIVPVLDACRKSKVFGVVLNYRDVP